jgi:chromosome segregation ATPase
MEELEELKKEVKDLCDTLSGTLDKLRAISTYHLVDGDSKLRELKSEVEELISQRDNIDSDDEDALDEIDDQISMKESEADDYEQEVVEAVQEFEDLLEELDADDMYDKQYHVWSQL